MGNGLFPPFRPIEAGFVPLVRARRNGAKFVDFSLGQRETRPRRSIWQRTRQPMANELTKK